MRKYKQVKRKEIIYGTTEWAEIEKRAAALSMKTGSYIKHISVSGQINVIDMGGVTPLMNALRSIGNNINQITKKANEINSIYANDFKKFQEDYMSLCLILSKTYSYQKQNQTSPCKYKAAKWNLIPLDGFVFFKRYEQYKRMSLEYSL